MPTPTMQPGIVETPHDALASTAATNSITYALPPGKWNIKWQCITGGASAASILLQIADRDTDAEYATLDTMSTAGGETRIVATVVSRFIRFRQASRTGGTLTVLASIGRD